MQTIIEQGVSEKSISFCNLITWLILIQMISNLNSMCKNNYKFNVLFFSSIEIPFIEKDVSIQAVKI